MNNCIVRNQTDLDRAIADGVEIIYIESTPGVWLTITDNKSSSVVARGSSRVVACGSSRVEAWESSRVVAWGSSSVVARESSRVVARESSSVEARESSSVVAWGSSRVVAWGSSSVVARESSRVEAWGSVTIQAHDKCKIKSTPLCAVMLHNATVGVQGGVIIDHTRVNDTDSVAWCEYHGVAVESGIATLYKAVNDQWTTERGIDYSPGTTPSCNDWCDDNACGNGLHFGPTPRHARAYFAGATKFVAVSVMVSELRPITGGVAKAKAPRVVRPCVEVDIDGNTI